MLAKEGGSVKHSLSTNEMPSHTHDKGSYRIFGQANYIATSRDHGTQSPSGALSRTYQEDTNHGTSGSHYYGYSYLNLDTNNGGFEGSSGASGGSVPFDIMSPYKTIVLFTRVN